MMEKAEVNASYLNLRRLSTGFSPREKQNLHSLGYLGLHIIV